MELDIHRLDDLDPSSTRGREELEAYQETLVNAFCEASEGQERLKADPSTGGWIGQLIYFGFIYLGATVPGMTVADAEEIVTELFPRKTTLASPDDADTVIPELIAFWSYLKRVHQLANADGVLTFLKQVQPKFKGIMNDPSKFGMAKSFVTLGQSQGFDMTNEREAQEFIALYNARLLEEHQEGKGRGLDRPDLPIRARSGESLRKKMKRIRRLCGGGGKKGRRKRR
jgi:hypothetical protein